MSTLRDLIFRRPSRQFQYLHVLLDLSSHEKDKVVPAGRLGFPQPLPPRGPDSLPPLPLAAPAHSGCWVVVVFPRVMS